MASRLRVKSTFGPNAAGAFRESGSLAKVPTSASMTNVNFTAKTPTAALVAPTAPSQTPAALGGLFFRCEAPEGFGALPPVTGLYRSAEEARASGHGSLGHGG